MSTLHDIVKKGDLEEVKRFCEKETFDVNEKNEEGRAPIHYAAGNGDFAITQYLLVEQDADVNASDKDGNTALHYAAGGRVLPPMNEKREL